MSELAVNGLEDIPIKTEPEDPLITDNVESEPLNPAIIPKEFLQNGVHAGDSDVEDIAYFTQVEVDNTRKCLENTRLVIKDFETQLDWHLQQYMTLRNIFTPKSTGKDGDKRDDHLSIAQLSAMIANHPEGNKKFIKRKAPIANTANRRRKNKKFDSEEEESDMSEEDSEFDEEDYGEDSEDIDDPKKKKRTTRGRKRKADDAPEVKDEIEEEEHELIAPKIEQDSDEEMEDYGDMDDEEDEEDMEDEEEEEEEEEEPPPKKTPAKRGRKPAAPKTPAKTPAKKTPAKTPAKRGRGKKAAGGAYLNNCREVLDRMNKSDYVEIKDEAFDKEELVELLKDKAITDLDELDIDGDKPISILRADNHANFDFNECVGSNVIVTFEDKEVLPDFVFKHDVAQMILGGGVILVQASVFDEHLADDDKN